MTGEMNEFLISPNSDEEIKLAAPQMRGMKAWDLMVSKDCSTIHFGIL